MTEADPADGAHIRVDRYRQAAGIGDGGENQYAGLRIHAMPGLHQRLGEVVRQLLPPGATVLDVAAGSGAMTRRLLDLGYQVHATDYVAENFRVAEARSFTTVDLNAPFANRFGQRFDGIVACEIIEHLENPRHFVRELHKMLAPGGHLVVTTPNIDSTTSKLYFMTAGHFLWFSRANYEGDGHITPIGQTQMAQVLAESGFERVAMDSFGDARRHLVNSPRLRLVGRLLGRLLSRATRIDGEILIVTARRSAGD